MDTITIKNLTVFAHHGVFPEEKKLGQKFLVSAVLHGPFSMAAEADELSKTVHYGDIAEAIVTFMQAHTYDLIETCAVRLAHHLLHRYPLLKGIDITLQKPCAPIGLPLEGVSVNISRSWCPAVIALGSNLGDKTDFLHKALEDIAAHPEIHLRAASSFYDTAPMGKVEQEDYVNAACLIDTLLSPDALLAFMQSLEQKAGRKRTVHWGPRTLDLDLIYYDDLIRHEPGLTLPHPHLQDRTFVLEPLAEICPNYVDPRFNLPISALLKRLRN